MLEVLGEQATLRAELDVGLHELQVGVWVDTERLGDVEDGCVGW